MVGTPVPGAAPLSLLESSSPTEKGQSDDRSEGGELDYDKVMKKLTQFPAFQFSGEGVNLFALMGLAGKC